jgi:hypothetical protein
MATVHAVVRPFRRCLRECHPPPQPRYPKR